MNPSQSKKLPQPDIVHNDIAGPESSDGTPSKKVQFADNLAWSKI
jgi:hypothetical protein